jgi:hypothetical protein
MQKLPIQKKEIAANAVLRMLKAIAVTKHRHHPLRCADDGNAVKAINSRRKQYPATPQTAMGSGPRMEYGDWETVSQLMDFDRAQKL